jgi:hypothetical protein
MANQHPAIKTLNRSEVEAFMIDLIEKAHIHCGFKCNRELLLISIDELLNQLLEFFGTLSLPDLDNAFKRGLLQEYGAFVGLSNLTYLTWVKYYMVSDVRKKALKAAMKVVRELEYVEPVLTEDQKKAIVFEGVINCFENFRKLGVLNDAGNVTYNYLEKLGIINLTNERKAEIRKIVEARMKQEAIDNKGTMTIQQALIKALEVDKIKAECKREALKLHFQMMLEMEININEVLNTNTNE